MKLTNPDAENSTNQILSLNKMIKGLEKEMARHAMTLADIQEVCDHQDHILCPNSCIKCGKALPRMPVGLN